MIKVINKWFHRYFSDPQAVLLAILLIVSFTVLMTMSQILAPVLASIVIAYLLDGLIKNLEHWHFPYFLAMFLVYSGFITVLIFFIVVLLPLLSYQLTELIAELPKMVVKGQQLLEEIRKDYKFLADENVKGIIDPIRERVNQIGKEVLSYSLSSIPTLIALVIYAILVPLLVFFFLKDKDKILTWLVGFLPNEHHVAEQVWTEMNAQMGNYVRGKVYEIFIVGIAAYFLFAYLDMNYASLLAVLVGLSVIIPYVGAVVVTFPVMIVAYFQWGLEPYFFWATGSYLILQALDGNVLVPLLFSEAVNLHPVAIMVSILVFGNLWGVWGVFFAIPLATLIKSLLTVWPRTSVE
jgi:putative permease